MNRSNLLSALDARRSDLAKIPSYADILEHSFLQCPISCDLALHPHQVLSTIAISISHDGYFIATTHGDHTVKIFIYHTSQLLDVLMGHPRYIENLKFSYSY